jgi:hypothetical protein
MPIREKSKNLRKNVSKKKKTKQNNNIKNQFVLMELSPGNNLHDESKVIFFLREISRRTQKERSGG